MITDSTISIRGLTSKQMGQIAEFTTEFTIDYTMDGSPQITFIVIDPEMKMFKANYFVVRRICVYKGLLFEIAAVEIGGGPGLSPQIIVQARTHVIQKMKREKNLRPYSRMTAFQYAAAVAGNYGLKFYGQPAPPVQGYFRVINGNNDESVWDVLVRAARFLQYAVFEYDGTLFFASENYLFGKIGTTGDSGKLFTGTSGVPAFGARGMRYIPITWPAPTGGTGMISLEMPRMRVSDNDVKASSGTAILERTNAVQVRPGMTVGISGLHYFDGLYLVSRVNFQEGVPNPVTVEYRTPEIPKKETTS